MGDITEEIYEEYKFFDLKNFQKWIGRDDVLKYPNTKNHRKLHPELYNFTFYYYTGYIVRNHSKIWCGYVNYENYPDKYEYIEKEIKTHGGITYMDDEKIGFDTLTWGDAKPNELGDPEEFPDKIYRDRDYAVEYVKMMALQLFCKLPKWSPQTHKFYPKLLKDKIKNLYKLWYMKSQLNTIKEKNVWISIISWMIELEKQEAYDNLLDWMK